MLCFSCLNLVELCPLESDLFRSYGGESKKLCYSQIDLNQYGKNITYLKLEVNFMILSNMAIFKKFMQEAGCASHCSRTESQLWPITVEEIELEKEKGQNENRTKKIK